MDAGERTDIIDVPSEIGPSEAAEAGPAAGAAAGAAPPGAAVPGAAADESPTPTQPTPPAARARTAALWCAVAVLLVAVAVLSGVVAGTQGDLDRAERRLARATASIAALDRAQRLGAADDGALTDLRTRLEAIEAARTTGGGEVTDAADVAASVARLTACVNRNLATVASGGGTLVRCGP